MADLPVNDQQAIQVRPNSGAGGHAVKEKDFQGWIVDVATRYGWRVWHVPRPMRSIGGGRMVPAKSGAGLPDLILMHADPPRLIFAEVKVKQPLSEEQKEFLRLARGLAQDFDAHVAAVRDVLVNWAGREMPGGWRNPIGVYTWRPGVEELIEAVLRGKVMVP